MSVKSAIIQMVLFLNVNSTTVLKENENVASESFNL